MSSSFSEIEASKLMYLCESDVKTNKTLTIQSNTIGFIPDMAIIKTIVYENGDNINPPTEHGTYTITSNLTNGVVSIFIPDIITDRGGTFYFLQKTLNPETRILLKNGLNNNVTFTVQNVFASTAGAVSLLVEFIKHKQKK